VDVCSTRSISTANTTLRSGLVYISCIEENRVVSGYHVVTHYISAMISLKKEKNYLDR
jgi:hypothetical protein